MRPFVRHIALFILLLSGISLTAQVRISNEEELQLVKETPMEGVYIHHNSALFFPGEYLFYSVYTINLGTFRLSNLSKVAYVQLIDENGQVVFTHKIFLDNGKGQGDYFFPTDLPSGNYKLVGFTHWMKNAGSDQFYMADITLLNPYRADQHTFLQPGGTTSCKEDAEDTAEIEGGKASGDVLSLELEKDTYSTGEKVMLRLANHKGPLGRGTYSLSVRKKDEFPNAGLKSAERYASQYPVLQKTVSLKVNDILNIPEQRGALVSGRVFNRSTSEPIADQPISISLPGNDFRVKNALTDEEGKFYTYITRPYEGSYGMAELLPPRDVSVSMEWISPENWEAEIPCFYSFSIDTTMAEAIRQRSIHNQIENSYFEAKPDSILNPDLVDPFQGDIPTVFELNDYTRFPTLRETLVEVITHVGVRRNDAGGYSMWVNPESERSGTAYMDDPPLVIVDGIMVPDPASIMEYDARKIARIKVLRQPYQLGGVSYLGMVVIETIDRIFVTEWESPFGSRFSYVSSQPEKRYFRQDSPSAHIPDFRYQLLWEPLIELGNSSGEVSFFTSQVPGTYEVRLEGYTSYGKPISLRMDFRVAAAE